MEVKSYAPSGRAFDDLANSISAAFDPEYVHRGQDVRILMIEEFEFWRTNSNMQVTIVVERRSDDSAKVTATVGGGASGLLNLTLGSEQKIMTKVDEELQSVFQGA